VTHSPNVTTPPTPTRNASTLFKLRPTITLTNPNIGLPSILQPTLLAPTLPAPLRKQASHLACQNRVGEMAKGNKKNIYLRSLRRKSKENTQPKLHADKSGHYHLPPHNKLQAHANSPCPHKETGQSPGLPNCRARWLMKIRKKIRIKITTTKIERKHAPKPHTDKSGHYHLPPHNK
jgi:hypothetical protein